MAQKATANQLLRFNIALSDVVAVVEAGSATGALTPDRSWVITRIATRVRRVLMPGPSAPTPGQDLDVEYGGGETVVSGHRVKAGKRMDLQSGQQYLMFLHSDPETRQLELWTTPYLIKDGRLNKVSVDGETPTPDPLEGRSLEKVATDIRRIPKSR